LTLGAALSVGIVVVGALIVSQRYASPSSRQGTEQLTIFDWHEIPEGEDAKAECGLRVCS
jgi:hypothetical protein